MKTFILNNLSGNLPDALGELSELERPDFIKNQLNGIVPAGILANPPLVTFQVSNNALTSNPPDEIPSYKLPKILFICN